MHAAETVQVKNLCTWHVSNQGQPHKALANRGQGEWVLQQRRQHKLHTCSEIAVVSHFISAPIASSSRQAAYMMETCRLLMTHQYDSLLGAIFQAKKAAFGQ